MEDDDIYEPDDNLIHDSYLILQNYFNIQNTPTYYIYNTTPNDIITYINNIIYHDNSFELTTEQCERIQDYLSSFR
jgi:hypothetical protein